MQITITDNGAGVSPEIRADLFTILSSGKKTGMGLGYGFANTSLHGTAGAFGMKMLRRAGRGFVLSCPNPAFRAV